MQSLKMPLPQIKEIFGQNSAASSSSSEKNCAF
jgi:hypothetical protein